MAERIRKYPRTPHIVGSRIQRGDEDLRCVSAEELLGRELVVEEKLDGSNSGVSFDAGGRLLLQSRDHFLDGGARERHFALFKTGCATTRTSSPNRSNRPGKVDRRFALRTGGVCGSLIPEISVSVIQTKNYWGSQ